MTVISESDLKHTISLMTLLNTSFFMLLKMFLFISCKSNRYYIIFCITKVLNHLFHILITVTICHHMDEWASVGYRANIFYDHISLAQVYSATHASKVGKIGSCCSRLTLNKKILLCSMVRLAAFLPSTPPSLY